MRSSCLLVLFEMIQLKVSQKKRCGTTANFSLLGDALFWGTARGPYLLLLRKLNQKKSFCWNHQFFKAIDKYAHTPTQKKRVPEEVKIGRTYTIFVFLTYLLCGRHPNPPPQRGILTLTPYPSREVYSGRAPPPPSN